MTTPSTPTTENFLFAYALTGDFHSGFQIVSDVSFSSVVFPAAGNVVVEDPNGGSISIGQQMDVVSEGLNIGLGTGTGYTYVAQANVADNGNTLAGSVIQDSSTGDFFFLTDSAYSGALGGGNGDITFTGVQDTFCFMAGTLIRTADGEVAIETLKRGDLVLTHDGRTVPVDWVGIQTVSLRFADKLRVLPIRIRAGALSDNVPCRDLLVSPDHAVLVDGALIHAGALVNGTSIVRETDVPTTFTYYHVEVEDHSLILAENAPAETFVDNVDRLSFDNWAEHEALYPNGKQVKELPYPRAKSHRQVPVRTRVMLAARAVAIGELASSAA